jgi:hypothetical protein
MEGAYIVVGKNEEERYIIIIIIKEQFRSEVAILSVHE